jgi:hypothetical protein
VLGSILWERRDIRDTPLPVRLAASVALILITEETLRIGRRGDLLAKYCPARQVMESGCTFGQEDDITILTLTRLAVSARADASTLNLSTQARLTRSWLLALRGHGPALSGVATGLIARF